MTPLQRLRIFLQAYPVSVPIFVLILSVLLFGITTDGKIFYAGNLSTILKQITPIGIVAIAQTIIILTAGIDLSIGAIMVLSTIIMGKLGVQIGLPEPLAIAIGLFAGGVMGYFNGLLVTRLRLPPFIVTLGTLYIFQALKLWYSGIRIDPQRRYGGAGAAADLLRQGHIRSAASRSSTAPSPSCCSPG